MEKLTITEEMLAAAETYMPLADKQAWALAIAGRCLEEAEPPRPEAGRLRALALPPMLSENFALKRMCLGKLLLEFYLKLPPVEELDGQAYDARFSEAPLWQLERLRRQEGTRETAGRLLDDYRELCRMTDNAIARQKEIANDPLLRLIDGLSAAFSPERLRQISEELGRLREEQGTSAGDAAPDEGAPERTEGGA